MPENNTLTEQESTHRPLDPGGRSASICSALDWLADSLRQLENAVCEMSPDPNSPSLLTCRTALRNAETIIAELKREG